MTVALSNVIPPKTMNMEQFAVPSWNEYVAGGLLHKTDADVLDSLQASPLQTGDNRFVTMTQVLAKQVSLEVSRYIVNCLWMFDGPVRLPDDTGQQLYAALENTATRFEGNALQIKTLKVMGKIVKDNHNYIDPDPFYAHCRYMLNSHEPESCIEVLSLIANSLEQKDLRMAFATTDRLLDAILEALINLPSQPQLHYNALLCFWLVSFETDASLALLQRCNFLPVTVNICRSTTKEKVVRMGVGMWRNMLTRAKNVVLPVLIGSKAVDFINNCLKKQFTDPDLMVDLHAVQENLEEAINNLTTFDEYSSEVKSENLDWTPAHKSELFWKDNAARLLEDNAELLKYVLIVCVSVCHNNNNHIRSLVRLLSSRDSKVVSIAAHDIGEFLRHHPAGKRYSFLLSKP